MLPAFDFSVSLINNKISNKFTFNIISNSKSPFSAISSLPVFMGSFFTMSLYLLVILRAICKSLFFLGCRFGIQKVLCTKLLVNDARLLYIVQVIS